MTSSQHNIGNVEEDDVVGLDVEGNDDKRFGPWPKKNEKIFVSLMDEEVKKGNRRTGTFTKQAWTYMREKMVAKTSYAYTNDQLRNKYNQLRIMFNKFQQLLKQTGVGWDPIANTVTAPDEVWERLFKVNKYAKKFRKHGLPYNQELMRIFGDTSATGEYAHPSTKAPSTSSTGSTNDHRNKAKLEVDDDTEKPMKKVRRKESYGASLTAALQTMAESNARKVQLMEMKMSEGSVAASGKRHDEERLYIKECLAALNNLKDIDAATYAKAMKMIREDVISREMFLEIPDDRKRDWIMMM